ncbi:site-specific DNA-methyltransferase [Tenacibaculum finnmarkense]|uniref:site-specific DNA-methyltransferase n=1 Tax=Tenacibaculum finnmarkense TaxID=2781243 RepID=UPI001EFAF76F|nr:site-specific DNA-methyltransferase [Tenacibaculum finnmarkense]MCG8754038.1 site-specific DNA-methyltransferase [Tenacibaculum finnmarkense]MCG8782775.1 site-specific DNA-methyltransferase [Tenacibaculum finnmarkense]
MNKIIPQTKDITTENINKIALLFPQVITEKEDKNGNTIKAIDFELLKQHLSKEIVEGADERYRLDWPGKRASILKANTPIDKTLKPDRESSVNFNETENVYIEGDNFEVLKILQESYLGKIKMIYIDPPYNTGKDFVYKDNFKVSKDAYEDEIGTEDEEGGKLFKNTDTNGRFHSDWLSMMYERLLVARNLLTDDGVILVNMDENEITNLNKLMESVFGEENDIGTIIWDKRNPKGDSKGVAYQHEYIVIFTKNKDKFFLENEILRPKKNARTIIKKANEIFKKLNKSCDLFQVNKDFSNWISKQKSFSGGEKAYNKIDEQGKVYQSVSMSWPNKKTAPDDYCVPLIHPITGKVCPLPERGWRNPSKTMERLLEDNLIIFGDDENTQPRKKYLLEENMMENLASLLYFGGSDTELLKELDIPFDTPKSIEVCMEHLISFTKSDDIILDFFSGSATTAHATMQLNAEDGGNRKFIMVQIPEETDEKSEAFKARYKTITKIGKERIRRAGKKILEENSEKLQERETPLDIGFRVYKTSESILKDVAKHPNEVTQTNLFESEDNIRKDASSEDILTSVLLDFALPLNLNIETKTIANSEIFIVDETSLVACFSDNIDMQVVDAMAKMQPIRAVFRDACFIDDKDLINTVESRFKQLAPNTKVHVI